MVGVIVLVGVIVAVGVGVGDGHGCSIKHSTHPPGYGDTTDLSGAAG
jgi:hypothetical protein